jgi:DNA-binding transcriptional LysR family regulator
MSDVSMSSVTPDAKGLLSGQYWGELRIFAEVARARSFNRAAERLGLSQPTIARKVRRLQDLIGAQLFVSTTQGVKLTARGEELASALLILDQSLFSLASDLKARANYAEGLVSLSITDGMAAFFAVPSLSDLSTRYPKIQLHIKGLGNLKDLRENQTDMMLTFSASDRPDITCQPLGSLNLIPIASRSYINRRGLPTVDNLSQHAFLQSHFYQADWPVWRDWQALCAKGHIAHYCDNTFAYGVMANEGLGIALLGTYLMPAKISVSLDLGVSASLPLYALALTERLESPPVRVVFDWLCETFSPERPWFRRGAPLSDLPEDLPALEFMIDR